MTPRSSASPRRFPWPLPGLVLGVLVIAVFAGALDNDFVNFDDNVYVTDNPMVQRGLSGESLAWAFTTGHATNWHPVTWISHMIDVELFGLDPRGHHAMAVLLHALNTVLLWHVLRLLTGAMWRSWIVAFWFGVHPLHVESVAWVAERKDVLSTCFFLLALWAYVRWVRRGSRADQGLLLGLYAVGLMTKPMLITLPALLLVLDFWPLGRWRRGGAGTDRGGRSGRNAAVPIRRLVVEKVPLLCLALVSSAVTYWVQSRGGAVTATETLSWTIRFGNACVSYFRYLGHMLWPVDLAVFYPHPGSAFDPWRGGLAALALAAITFIVIRERARRPYLFTGWFWYAGTLVPVAGFVQAGAQSMADRYTYIPLIGIFLAIAWGLGELIQRRPALRTAVLAAAGVSGVALCALTVRQVEYWKDSVALFTQTRSVTGPNWMAEQALGFAFGRLGNHAAALPHYDAALQIRPGLAEVYRARGISLAALDRPAEAFASYEEAIRNDPDYAQAYYDYGVTLAAEGWLEDAVARYVEAIRLRPAYPEALNNLGVALAMLGRAAEAREALERARALDPRDASVHNNLGNLAATEGRMDEAREHWSEALRLDPGNTEARRNLEAAGGAP